MRLVLDCAKEDFNLWAMKQDDHLIGYVLDRLFEMWVREQLHVTRVSIICVGERSDDYTDAYLLIDGVAVAAPGWAKKKLFGKTVESSEQYRRGLIQ